MKQPIIFSYCATFLKAEAQHIYRQISSISKFRNVVITRKMENRERFPYPKENLEVLKKSPFRFAGRIINQLRGVPQSISAFEKEQLLRLSKKQNAKLVHVYLGTEALRVLSYLKEEKCKKVISFHGADLSYSMTPQKIKELSLAVDLVLCRTQDMKRELIERGCPADQVKVFYTGVPIEKQMPKRKGFEVSTSRPLQLLQACRFIPKKGITHSIECLYHLKELGVPAILTLAGEGPEFDKARVLASQLGVLDYMMWKGFLNQKELRRMYQTHDFFLHPSILTDKGDREGIPNSLLEAMSYGMPVVSTAHGGIPEVIQNGENGFILDQAKGEEMANRIKETIEEPGRYEKMAGFAYETVKKNFSIEVSRDNLEKYYSTLIAK